MEIKVDIGDTVSNIIKRAKALVEGDVESRARAIASDLIQSGRYGGKEGLAHEIIRKRVEDYILSEKFGQSIDSAIEKIADEETEKALRVLLNSRTRKHLFQATESVEKSNWIIRHDDEKQFYGLDTGLTYDRGEADNFTDLE